MCGITGIVRFDGQAPDREQLARMTEALAHRGPDGHGLHIEQAVGLGHRRLSIIDLALGRQPMQNEDGTVWVTFNGEIYNFRQLKRQLQSHGHTFRTDCDTEVILHAYEQWGAACVERFRGMFAFAVVNFRTRKLLLARDHFGIKPLFYRLTREYIAFASELAAFRQMEEEPLAVHADAIELFLRYQYVPAPHTIYTDVHKLPPAHTLEIDLDWSNPMGKVQPRRYWHLRFEPDETRSEESWLDEVEATLTDAIEASLVCDVPFGVFLSGGVDSTLVALKMKQILGGPVKAFTIGFEEEQYCELPYAQQAAAKIGVELNHEIVRPDALATLPDLIRHYGEPFGDSSCIPTWHVCRLARQHVPMVLSGDGGDEIFGGYHSYRCWMRDVDSVLSYRSSRPTWKKSVLALLRACGYDYDHRKIFSHQLWQQQMLYVTPPWRRQLWRDDYRGLVERPCELFDDAQRRAPHCDPLAFAQFMDVETYMPCAILTKVDVASMYHALEVRPSLLDVRVAELAARLPLSMRMRTHREVPFTGKWALKGVLSRHFPQDFVYRTKQGFGIPRDRWFWPGAPARAYLEDMVHDRGSHLSDWLEPKAMQQLVARHDVAEDRSGPLWLLLVLGIWLNQHAEQAAAPTLQRAA